MVVLHLPKKSASKPRRTRNMSGESDHHGSDCGECRDALILLQKENQQLRRELQDAHYRIQELQRPPPIVISHADDDSSFEVQSVADISITSSTSTLPTGSALANEKRAQLERRQERESQRRKQRWKKNRQRSLHLLTSATYDDPPDFLHRTHGGIFNNMLQTAISESEDEQSTFSGLFLKPSDDNVSDLDTTTSSTLLDPVMEVSSPSTLARRDSLSVFLEKLHASYSDTEDDLLLYGDDSNRQEI